MAPTIGFTFDAVHAPTLAAFWKGALGYEDEPAPAPFASREEWLAAHDVPEEEWSMAAYLRDPTGRWPRIAILEVPEQKVAKNRLHLDLYVSHDAAPGEAWDHIVATVDRLCDAGATVVARYEPHHVTLADPEGNEFCVA